MKNNQQGFTLIELMIVIAIIAILAAIALPAYQDYLIRSQVSEGAVLASGAKTAVAEYYSNTGEFPANNESAGLAASASILGTYVTDVDVAATTAGVIEATYGNDANTAIATGVLAFSALTNAGSITWVCKDGGGAIAIEGKYLPTSCR